MNREGSSAAVGWSAFAAVMMLMMGVWWMISGLVAIVNKEFYVVSQEWILKLDVTIWGWIHLMIGLIILLAGIGVLSGAIWARAVGTAIAFISALTAFAWLPYYPFWGFLYIAVSIVVIWALTTHSESAETSQA